MYIETDVIYFYIQIVDEFLVLKMSKDLYKEGISIGLKIVKSDFIIRKTVINKRRQQEFPTVHSWLLLIGILK